MRIRPATLALVLFLPLAGCVVAAAAAIGAVAYGAISYRDNEATMDVQQDLPTVYEAARAAMRELGFAVDDTQQPGPTEGTLKASDARVIVERHAGDFTRVRARVGTFDTEDNRRRSKLILEAIQRRL